jgi:hypothetical protein
MIGYGYYMFGARSVKCCCLAKKFRMAAKFKMEVKQIILLKKIFMVINPEKDRENRK